MREKLRLYWPVYLVVAVGASVMLGLSFTLGSGALTWAGAVIGIAVGLTIAAVQRRGR